jgi:ankyrin repeat protein
VREFFSDAAEGGRYLSQSPNKDLAEICITYMSFTTFTQPCPYRKDFPELYAEHPVFHYAIKHWGKHASRCESSDVDMQKKINDMIDPEKINLGTLEGILHGNGCLHIRSYERLVHIRPTICRFHLAIFAGLDNIVEEMLQSKSPEMACKDWKERTPLQLAAEMGSKRMVELLLEHLGTEDVTMCSISNKDALCRAMLPPWETASCDWEKQHHLMRDFLQDLESQPEQDYNSQREVRGSLQEQLETTRALIELMRLLDRVVRDSAPDVMQKQEKTRTDLILTLFPELTISQESIEIAKLLVLNGADINSMQFGLASPLQLAVIYGCKELVDFFLSRNANPFLTERLGYTAYELACMRGSEDIKNVISTAMDALDTREQSLESDEQKEGIYYSQPRSASKRCSMLMSLCAAIPGRAQAARLDREMRSRDMQGFRFISIQRSSSQNNAEQVHASNLLPGVSSPASRAPTPMPGEEAES